MLSRAIYLNNIADNLGLLSKQVSVRNAINLYDINIIAEDFYPGLINIIINSNLENINTVEKNAPGIDLIDENKRLAFQVTADNTSDKIKHTINEYINNGLYTKFDKLIILILTEKKNYRKDFDTQDKFIFNKDQDIWDVKTLITKIRNLPVEKIEAINDFLKCELYDKYVLVNNRTEANEVDTIIDLIEYISSNKKVEKLRNVLVDPEYKICKRFKEFAQNLISQYTELLVIYGSALKEIENTRGSDEAQDIVIRIYLQDISIDYLNKANNDPVNALNLLTSFFSDKLSENGKKYDQMAIKFYLIDKMIQCSVFPNERSEVL